MRITYADSSVKMSVTTTRSVLTRCFETLRMAVPLKPGNQQAPKLRGSRAWVVFTIDMSGKQRLNDRTSPTQKARRRSRKGFDNAVRPAKAGAFSGSQSRQGKSQEPCSLSRRQEGNQVI